jgi:hypothetical protein
MDPVIFIWLIYALWFVLVIYLTVRNRGKAGASRTFVAEFRPHVRHHHRILASPVADIPFP